MECTILNLSHYILLFCIAYNFLKLSGATNITNNSNKDKWVISGYGIAFDG